MDKVLIKRTKATRSQMRMHNRKLVLRGVYEGSTSSRAALAHETGLAKPTISELVAELIEAGLLVEEGFGVSTDSGGKRPRLLRFLPDSRQVIGVALHQQYVLGVLSHLDGRVTVEHRCEVISTAPNEVFAVLVEVINGLYAQLEAPLLCISVGIPALVDDSVGIVRHAPRFGWYDVPLAHMLREHFHVETIVSNAPELAALAQVAFDRASDGGSLATVMISNSIGFGMINPRTGACTGSEIGHLIMTPSDPDSGLGLSIEQRLGWHSVAQRARVLGAGHNSAWLMRPDLNYLHIRRAVNECDRAALILHDELSRSLAKVFAWVIALLRPRHLTLAGRLALLGDEFLTCTVEHTCSLVLPDLVQATTFSLEATENLVAVGAVAKAVQQELGII